MSLRVCVYCASGPVAAEHLDLASAVGTAIAERGWELVSGGGRVSMMGALARAARAGGARTIGVIPRGLLEREVADTDADELVVTDTMRARKAGMDDRTDAFVTLPGGLGTLEELVETWTAGALGMHPKPVVVLDPTGHYDGLLRWLDGLVERGFVRRAALDRITVTTTVAAALDACAAVPRPADAR